MKLEIVIEWDGPPGLEVGEWNYRNLRASCLTGGYEIVMCQYAGSPLGADAAVTLGLALRVRSTRPPAKPADAETEGLTG